MPDDSDVSFDDRKARASGWFRELRDSIVAAFEALEDSQSTGPFAEQPAGRFEVTETRRAAEREADAGGGLMSVMRGGRVFEKVGVNISTVYGTLGDAAQVSMAARGVPGITDDPRFWASGISLVAHMQNPHTPAVHMNTRMFWTPNAWWFGGGADLNPPLPREEDTAYFHDVLKRACDAHDGDYYPRFKAWADEYFYIPHRGVHRGVGGIFYDHLECADDAGFDANFAFTRAVGEAFLEAYPPIVRRRMSNEWSEADYAQMLEWRGRYAEFNLVHDRGTLFGLKTGGNIEAILMSLPPMASWS